MSPSFTDRRRSSAVVPGMRRSSLTGGSSLLKAGPGRSARISPLQRSRLPFLISIPSGNRSSSSPSWNLTGPGGELELIFVHVIGDLNVQDRDRCLSALRALKVTVEGSLHQARPPSPVRRDSAGAAVTSEGENVRPAVPEWTVYGTPRYIRQAPEEAPPQSPLVLIIAAVLIIGLCIGGILIAGHLTESKPVPGTDTVPGQEAGVTKNIIPTKALLPGNDTRSCPECPFRNGCDSRRWCVGQGILPGEFFRNCGSRGMDDRGERYRDTLYHLPVHDAVIEGTVDRLDGSGNTLDIGIYNGGTLVSESTTAKPWGSVDLTVPIGPAYRECSGNYRHNTNNRNCFPHRTPHLSCTKFPPSGIWVRVTYRAILRARSPQTGWPVT